MALVGRCIRLIRNACLDLRYGGFLGGTHETPLAHLGIEDTANTDYGALPFIFTAGVIGQSDVLVDIGCGKGRVINWWLSRRLTNEIIGIELDEAVALKTRQRLRSHENVKIVSGDAIAKLPPNGTIFYLFNPFKESWVRALKDRLAQLVAEQDSTVFYYNCLHVDVFKQDLQWSVREVVLPRPFHRLAVIKMVDKSAVLESDGNACSPLKEHDLRATSGRN